MKLNTIDHFKDLYNICFKMGLASMLEYDLNITRARNDIFNHLLANAQYKYEKIMYKDHMIALQDRDGLLIKLRLHPELPYEHLKGPRWDWQYQKG